MKPQAVYRRDDHTCQFCGNGASSLDHLLPKVLGGRDEWDNLVAACGSCNRLKGERHYPKLVTSMQQLIHLGRTGNRHYPPLYWQVQALGLPHEALETNLDEGRWFDRTLLKLIFFEPGQAQPLKRRSKLGALRKLVSAVPHYDLEDASEVLTQLCEKGQLREAEYGWLERSVAWLPG